MLIIIHIGICKKKKSCVFEITFVTTLEDLKMFWIRFNKFVTILMRRE